MKIGSTSTQNIDLLDNNQKKNIPATVMGKEGFLIHAYTGRNKPMHWEIQSSSEFFVQNASFSDRN